MDLLPGSLIHDALERIMGFLGPSDRRAACLVNSAFRAAVSTNVRIISVPTTRKNTWNRVRPLLTEFQQHSEMTVHLQKGRDWAGWVDPG